MIDMEKIGKRIAALRRGQGYTGEGLAERLHVSPQAVSKWENGRSLPETAILPALADALHCSIDSLLQPGELFILEAVWTDGQTHIPVTRQLNSMVRGNDLALYSTDYPRGGTGLPGNFPESGRLKLLTVKFQTPRGIFYSFTPQSESFILDKDSIGSVCERPFQLLGAYYGNEKRYTSVIQKMEHYEYFEWDRIPVNHETFPSDTASDDTEYLTLVYLNSDGIHVISCPEGDAIYYGKNRTQLLLRDHSRCILKGIERLSWGKGMECPWAGALYAALQYMGESCTYHQIMGMSGACYRVCFTDVWDYSCTDALVAFDYATPLYRAVGYSFRMAERLEKQERKAERLAIMEDIQNGRPVLAINLRIAPEWGVITGYTESGNRFLCRTYFDDEILDTLEKEEGQDPEERRMILEENEGYLFSDFWPFLIAHFGEKREKPTPADILKTSLELLVQSFDAGESRGYYQGREAYEAWMRGLSCLDSGETDSGPEGGSGKETRQLCVNDNMLCHLLDARSAAARWLRENLPLLTGQEREYLEEIARNCQRIADKVCAFQERVRSLSKHKAEYNTVDSFGVDTPELRREQIRLLENALTLDEESCRLAKMILSSEELKQQVY